MAAAFVAVVIAQLVFFPSGSLATLPLAWRLLAMVAGCVAFLAARQRIAVGIVVSQAVLALGLW